MGVHPMPYRTLCFVHQRLSHLLSQKVKMMAEVQQEILNAKMCNNYPLMYNLVLLLIDSPHTNHHLGPTLNKSSQELHSTATTVTSVDSHGDVPSMDIGVSMHMV